MSKYKIGAIIKGQVSGIEQYGVFLSIDAFYSGLIHISEISDGFVKNINDYVQMGDIINAKILEIDENNLQIKLSIKNIDYKSTKQTSKIKESKNGFEPLKEQLEIWTKEKLQEIEEIN